MFSTGDDPVATELVANLNRPGGNLTGVSYPAGVLPPKQLELLHELLPKVSTIGHLINPNKSIGITRPSPTSTRGLA